MNPEDFKTVQEAAVYLEMTPKGIRTAVHRGKLAYTETLYGRNLIAVKDLKEYKSTTRRGRPKKDAAPTADAKG